MSNRVRPVAILCATGLVAAAVGCGSDPDPEPNEGDPGGDGGVAESPTVIELAAAKLVVEHDATDDDTGFRGFVDGQPWNRMIIEGTDGEPVVSVKANGRLSSFGLTELAFTTSEPRGDEVTLATVLDRLPAGEYDFTGQTVSGDTLTGVATLSHTIPAGPVIISPVEPGVRVDPAVQFRWSPVTTDVSGQPTVEITHYQLVVERLDQPPTAGFARERLDVTLPATVRAFAVPGGFFQRGSNYRFEVVAIDIGGNQTITSGEFLAR